MFYCPTHVLISTLIKQLLQGGGSADAQSVHPTGNCRAVTHALESGSQIDKTELPMSSPGRKLWVVHCDPSDITVSSCPGKHYMVMFSEK